MKLMDCSDAIKNHPLEYPRDNGGPRKKAELLSTISDSDWQPQSQHDISAFSQHLDALAVSEVETRFRRMILAQLHFRHMPTRAEGIPLAHSETLGWLLEDDSRVQGQRKWAILAKWLQEEDKSIYWVTGKPGSGKSTLMKFLYHHDSLPTFLEKWSGMKKLVKAGFYFWNSGSTIQMSRFGLLRALLHACFSQNEALLPSAMHERWEAFRIYGGGLEPFDEAELQRAFDRVISDETQRFFFLIDGLDEFEGEPKDIIRFVLGAAKLNVKLCVASRPWLPFEDAFQQRPSLLLETLTEKDIAKYVKAHFHGNQHFLHLRSFEPEVASALLRDVIHKASGVFLWVHLVVQSLLEGLQESDRLPDLQMRLDSLPEGLEALFDKLLDRLNPKHFGQACAMFRLLRAYQNISQFVKGNAGAEPLLLELYLADDPDTNSALTTPIKVLDEDAALQRSEAMRRRLITRCRGFLEIRNDHESQSSDKKVGYLHRTAKDFIESDTYWSVVLEHTNHDDYKPEEHWANALMWLWKAYPFVIPDKLEYDRKYTESAFMIQNRTGVVQKTRLDEFYRVRHLGIIKKPHYRKELLDFKLWSASVDRGLYGYVALVLEEADLEASSWTLKALSKELCKNTSKLERTVLEINISYYRTPRILRWLRRRPVLPKYE
jgi:hypothetical protein